MIVMNAWKKWEAQDIAEKKAKEDGVKFVYEPREECAKKVKYTKSDKGVQHWGGWSSDGRSKWTELTKEIKKARKGKHVEKVEKDALLRIRTKAGLETKEAKEKADKAANRAKKQLEEEDEEGDDFLDDL